MLPAEPASAARARDFVRSLLRSSRHRALEDAALLCVTELVANVAVHTRSRQCVITLVDEPDDVLIEVADEAAEPPVLRGRMSGAEHGRGLFIINALAGEEGAEVITLGTTVRHVDGRPFLGHTVEQVLTHSPATVVVVALPEQSSRLGSVMAEAAGVA